MKKILPVSILALSLLGSCGNMNAPDSNRDVLAKKDSVELPKMPMDTIGTGPSFTKLQDSVRFLNAPKDAIVKRVEAWRFDESAFGAGKRELELSQTFYGGGARLDSVLLTYAGNGRLSDVNFYNAKGLPVREDDWYSVSSGTRCVKEYDDHGNLITETYFDIHSGQNGKLSPSFGLPEEHYINAYDDHGNLIHKQRYSEKGKITQDYNYTYDLRNNQLTEKGYAAFSNGDTVHYDTSFEYDASNHVTKKTDRGGFFPGELNYEYDAEEKQVRTYNDHVSRTYYYDKKGNVVIESCTSYEGGTTKTSYLKYNWIYY